MKLPQMIARPLVKASLRSSFKLPSLLPLPLPVLRGAMEGGALLFKPRADVLFEDSHLAGVPAQRVSPQGQAGGVLLHFHGGAFFAGSSRTHRALASELAARAQVSVYMLDYRRAPEHPYPAALDDGLAAYGALLAQGWRAEQIILGGDSGGCAHILALAIALRDRGQPLPAALVMISPFVDLTLSLPSVTANARRDPMVTAHALRRGGDGYRGDIPADDPRVSPLFADLRDLPPTLIQAGSEEILLDDALALCERGRQAGMIINSRIYGGMWHNFQMFNALISTADLALDELAGFMRRQLAQTGSTEIGRVGNG